MTYYETVKAKLEQHPDFRERRFRGKGLMILSLRHHNLEDAHSNGRLTIEDLISLAGTYDSYRHEFDAVQRDCIHLRGKDYDDKKKVVQEKLLQFQYEVGYRSDLSTR
jgi:hypothetical protein